MKDGLLDWEELWWIEHHENEQLRAENEDLRKRLDAAPLPLLNDAGGQVFDIISTRTSKSLGHISANSGREAVLAAVKAGYRGGFRAVALAAS